MKNNQYLILMLIPAAIMACFEANAAFLSRFRNFTNLQRAGLIAGGSVIGYSALNPVRSLSNSGINENNEQLAINSLHVNVKWTDKWSGKSVTSSAETMAQALAENRSSNFSHLYGKPFVPSFRDTLRCCWDLLYKRTTGKDVDYGNYAWAEFTPVISGYQAAFPCDKDTTDISLPNTRAQGVERCSFSPKRTSDGTPLLVGKCGRYQLEVGSNKPFEARSKDKKLSFVQLSQGVYGAFVAPTPEAARE